MSKGICRRGRHSEGERARGARRALLFALLLALCLLSAGCNRGEGDLGPTASAAPITPTPLLSAAPASTPEPTPAPEPLRFSMWTPYWDYASAVGEIPFCSENTDKLIAFGAIFDWQDRVLMLPEMNSTAAVLTELCRDGREMYISFVNDIELAQGSYSNKDWQLLTRLLADESAMDAHIADVLATAQSYGADGIEIDYENVEDAGELLWAPFARFIEKLYSQTVALGLKLRVVLGWDFARHAAFPEGPEYVVMCYNLYGYHSGPGPKADKDFLELTYSINQSLPGRVVMAFATGGFDWTQGGGITALTERSAARLLGGLEADAICSTARDEASRCVRFVYTKNGETHEVWYADAETLLYWRSLGVARGYRDFALFRLGGNDPATLRAFTKAE